MLCSIAQFLIRSLLKVEAYEQATTVQEHKKATIWEIREGTTGLNSLTCPNV